MFCLNFFNTFISFVIFERSENRRSLLFKYKDHLNTPRSLPSYRLLFLFFYSYCFIPVPSFTSLYPMERIKLQGHFSSNLLLTLKPLVLPRFTVLHIFVTPCIYFRQIIEFIIQCLKFLNTFYIHLGLYSLVCFHGSATEGSDPPLLFAFICCDSTIKGLIGTDQYKPA